MITTGNQRWRNGRDSYRRPDEQIKTRLYEVASIPDNTTAKNFVIEHHYEGSYPAARFRFGLYQGQELVGVSVFSIPMNVRVLHIFPGDPGMSVELGRLVLLDKVPGNGESWFLARCFECLKQQGIIGIVSHSDPMPRKTAEKEVVFCGHVGYCYQALNAAFIGRTSSKYQRVLPDGTIFSERAISKVRAKAAGKPVNVCQGWEYACGILRRFGAAEPKGDLHAWLRRWLDKLTRSQYHPGNYKYAWILPKRLRDKMPVALPYPKVTVRPELVA